MSPELYSNRPLLDKLGVKPGSRVAVIDIADAWFVDLLRTRTSQVMRRKPRTACDLVFLGVSKPADLERIRDVKHWIEPDGAVWVVRPKGPGTPIRDVDLIEAGLAAGLVDNKIASFSETHGVMRFVYRLRDRPA